MIDYGMGRCRNRDGQPQWHIAIWMTVFVVPIRCGHLRGSWAKEPSFVQGSTDQYGVDSRGRGRCMVGTTLVDANANLERAGPVGSTS